MKLKRFLLKYDPPGVGLEVEASDGTCEVRHKSLPPAGEMSTKDISGLVDQLISGEQDLLSKRRHRPALMKLLGRLYQISVEDEDVEHDEDAPASPSSAEPSCPEEGQCVCLINLKGKLQVHNGELGTLTKAKGEKGKFEVTLAPTRTNDQSEVVKVRGAEHLVPVAAKGTSLVVGTHVAIRGLRNHVELNGCLGRVVECHEETSRYEVRATESGQLFRVKQENLVPIEFCAQVVSAAANAKENREPNLNATPRKKEAGGPTSSGGEHLAGKDALGVNGAEDDAFEPGSLVQLTGLKTAMCYNGQQAEVLSVDRSRGRYEIRLADGSVKTIRAENVRLVSAPTKASPRTRRQKDGGPSSGKATDRAKP